MKQAWNDHKGLFLFLIALLAVAVLVAGFFGLRHSKDVRQLNWLEDNMPAKVHAMLQETEKQDTEAILACLHPVAGKFGDEAVEGIQELLEIMDGRTVSQVQLSAPKTWERGEGEYLAESNGIVTLSDGSQHSLTYTYLSDGSKGFIEFRLENKGVNV